MSKPSPSSSWKPSPSSSSSSSSQSICWVNLGHCSASQCSYLLSVQFPQIIIRNHHHHCHQYNHSHQYHQHQHHHPRLAWRVNITIISHNKHISLVIEISIHMLCAKAQYCHHNHCHNFGHHHKTYRAHMFGCTDCQSHALHEGSTLSTHREHLRLCPDD